MTRRNRPRPTPAPTAFEQARDELFYHVVHCGVPESDPAHHDEWFDETMRYMADRYPELGDEQLSELRTVGERFARPPKARQTRETAA